MQKGLLAIGVGANLFVYLGIRATFGGRTVIPEYADVEKEQKEAFESFAVYSVSLWGSLFFLDNYFPESSMPSQFAFGLLAAIFQAKIAPNLYYAIFNRKLRYM